MQFSVISDAIAALVNIKHLLEVLHCGSSVWIFESGFLWIFDGAIIGSCRQVNVFLRTLDGFVKLVSNVSRL